MAFSLWTSEFWWLKNVTTGEYGDVSSTNQSPSQICEDCVFSKQHRDNFLKGKPWRAKKVLELIHSDICELINPTSNCGKCYCITFVDDYRKKTWVYFLQEESETFYAFKNFKALKETWNTIKILRSVCGREYTSQEFVSSYEAHGIQKQLPAAYAL